MEQRHYCLQALLYTVAVHRYLGWRLPGYDAERHLGGVLYLFVRGMTGPDTPLVGGAPGGVFAWGGGARGGGWCRGGPARAPRRGAPARPAGRRRAAPPPAPSAPPSAPPAPAD